MAQYLTDIRHLAPIGGLVDLPDGAWQFRDYLGRIISAATARPNLPAFTSGIPCRVKISRKKCQGSLAVKRLDLPTAVIIWQCTHCNEGGELSGWRGHLYDNSSWKDYAPEPGEKYLSISLTDDEFRALLDADNIYDPDSDKIVLTGFKTNEGVEISGWEGDMDSFIGYVAGNANDTENKRLGKLLHSVCEKIQSELDACFETSVLR